MKLCRRDVSLYVSVATDRSRESISSSVSARKWRKIEEISLKVLKVPQVNTRKSFKVVAHVKSKEEIDSWGAARENWEVAWAAREKYVAMLSPHTHRSIHVHVHPTFFHLMCTFVANSKEKMLNCVFNLEVREASKQAKENRRDSKNTNQYARYVVQVASSIIAVEYTARNEWKIKLFCDTI